MTYPFILINWQSMYIINSMQSFEKISTLEVFSSKQPIIALYLEFETILKYYNLEASSFFLSEIIA